MLPNVSNMIFNDLNTFYTFPTLIKLIPQMHLSLLPSIILDNLPVIANRHPLIVIFGAKRV